MMTPLAIILLVLLLVLISGAFWPRVGSDRALYAAAAIVAVLFVLSMLKLV